MLSRIPPNATEEVVTVRQGDSQMFFFHNDRLGYPIGRQEKQRGRKCHSVWFEDGEFGEQREIDVGECQFVGNLVGGGGKGVANSRIIY